MKIDFIKELEKLKLPVWKVFSSYLPVKEPFGHYEMIREYPLRHGKYLRPGLLLLSLEMFGGNRKDGLLIAAAMQASEDWLLIHDDVEDHSEERRHKPTLHVQYGEELAVNAGDALHMIMWKIAGDYVRKSQSKNRWQVFNKLNEILIKTTEGQYLELAWIKEKKVSISEKEYLEMVKRKTSYYSIIAPLQLGALIAGASEDEVKGIEEWGLPFGYAFQLADDAMNVSSKKQGKELAGDIMEGKRTLILIHLLSSCTKEEKKNIRRIYRKDRKKKTEKEKQYILSRIRKYQSDVYVKKEAKRYTKLAKTLFTEHTSRLPKTKAREVIRAGIDFVANRDY